MPILSPAGGKVKKVKATMSLSPTMRLRPHETLRADVLGYRQHYPHERKSRCDESLLLVCSFTRCGMGCVVSQRTTTKAPRAGAAARNVGDGRVGSTNLVVRRIVSRSGRPRRNDRTASPR